MTINMKCCITRLSSLHLTQSLTSNTMTYTVSVHVLIFLTTSFLESRMAAAVNLCVNTQVMFVRFKLVLLLAQREHSLHAVSPKHFFMGLWLDFRGPVFGLLCRESIQGNNTFP